MLHSPNSVMATMTDQMTPEERSRESVRKWYARNRESFSALRKKRYRKDPKRRVKARKAAADYRKRRQKGLKVKRVLLRELNGVMVPAYSSGYVADRVKVSAPVLRGWQARGWLPEPVFKDAKHRLYTARQVELIRLLADAQRSQKKVGISREARDALLGEVVGVIHKTWKVNDHGSQDGKKARRGQRRG